MKMCQDKMFAQTLLMFSVANVALAAPAVVRRRHREVATGRVTLELALEKRVDKLPPVSEFDSVRLPPPCSGT